MDSEQNKQLVMQAYQMYQAGDIDGILQLFTDDCEWSGSLLEDVPFSGSYHGKQEVAQFFADLDLAQTADQFEPEEFIAEGDKVVVTGQSRWTVKSTGKSYDNPWVQIFTIRDGKVAEFRQFNDTAATQSAYRASDVPAQPATGAHAGANGAMH
jgi:uncharacterized protein